MEAKTGRKGKKKRSRTHKGGKGEERQKVTVEEMAGGETSVKV